MSVKLAKPEHEVAFQDVLALVNKNDDSISAEELLAVAANMLGKLVALQDPRTMTSERAMEIIGKNIELGNAQVLKAQGLAEYAIKGPGEKS